MIVTDAEENARRVAESEAIAGALRAVGLLYARSSSSSSSSSMLSSAAGAAAATAAGAEGDGQIGSGDDAVAKPLPCFPAAALAAVRDMLPLVIVAVQMGSTNDVRDHRAAMLFASSLQDHGPGPNFVSGAAGFLTREFVSLALGALARADKGEVEAASSDSDGNGGGSAGTERFALQFKLLSLLLAFVDGRRASPAWLDDRGFDAFLRSALGSPYRLVRLVAARHVHARTKALRDVGSEKGALWSSATGAWLAAQSLPALRLDENEGSSSSSSSSSVGSSSSSAGNNVDNDGANADADSSSGLSSDATSLPTSASLSFLESALLVINEACVAGDSSELLPLLVPLVPVLVRAQGNPALDEELKGMATLADEAVSNSLRLYHRGAVDVSQEFVRALEAEAAAAFDFADPAKQPKVEEKEPEKEKEKEATLTWRGKIRVLKILSLLRANNRFAPLSTAAATGAAEVAEISGSASAREIAEYVVAAPGSGVDVLGALQLRSSICALADRQAEVRRGAVQSLAGLLSTASAATLDRCAVAFLARAREEREKARKAARRRARKKRKSEKEKEKMAEAEGAEEDAKKKMMMNNDKKTKKKKKKKKRVSDDAIGVLGLCALLLAFPFTVQNKDVCLELARHASLRKGTSHSCAHDTKTVDWPHICFVVSQTLLASRFSTSQTKSNQTLAEARDAFISFRSTHAESWPRLKAIFSAEELGDLREATQSEGAQYI